ncbi:Indole-3-glycerol phosphate synthase [Candidatus Vidania fulgoroideae]|nr:Indole-3-glycerol phosphate synthase [Candidatus Vidania fulgoroideae]
MLKKILLDEIYKNYVLEKKYIKKRIKKISFFKIMKRKKIEFKKKSLLIAEKKEFSPFIGLNRKFNIKRFKDIEKKRIFFFSKLTNSKFFSGNLYKENGLFLRKDFITDYCQVLFTLIYDYKYVLLIRKIFSFEKLKNLCKVTKFLGMVPLIELDKAIEIKKIIEKKIKNILLGINSRNLKKFKIYKRNSILNIKKKEKIIYESGISNRNEMIKINNIGFKITLVGENLTKNNFYYEKNSEIYKKKNRFNKKDKK